MASYDVYRNGAGDHEAIKIGFSWPAFFFNFIWAYLKRLRLLGTALLVIGVMISIRQGVLEISGEFGGATVLSLINLAIAIWVGVNGNRLRRDSMVRRQYTLVGQGVMADNGAEAIAALTPVDTSWPMEHDDTA